MRCDTPGRRSCARMGLLIIYARMQMRHQTIRQTDGYTDATQLPIDDSIKNLPRLEDHTQIGAQILGADV